MKVASDAKFEIVRRTRHARFIADRFITQVMEEACRLSGLSLETGVSWKSLITIEILEDNLETWHEEWLIEGFLSGDTVLQSKSDEDASIMASTPLKNDQGDALVRKGDFVLHNIEDGNKGNCRNGGDDKALVRPFVEVDLISVARDYFENLISKAEDGLKCNNTYILDIESSQQNFVGKENSNDESMELPPQNTTNSLTVKIEYTESNIPDLIDFTSDQIPWSALREPGGSKQIIQIIDHSLNAPNEKHVDVTSNRIETSDEGENETPAGSSRKIVEPQTQSSVMSLLEKTFLTLNRDEECCSEDDEEPEGEGGLIMHEVELLMASSSEDIQLDNKADIIHSTHEIPVKVEEAPTKGERLARRWRGRGARLLSWLRRLLRSLLRRRRAAVRGARRGSQDVEGATVRVRLLRRDMAVHGRFRPLPEVLRY